MPWQLHIGIAFDVVPISSAVIVAFRIIWSTDRGTENSAVFFAVIETLVIRVEFCTIFDKVRFLLLGPNFNLTNLIPFNWCEHITVRYQFGPRESLGDSMSERRILRDISLFPLGPIAPDSASRANRAWYCILLGFFLFLFL